jgi:hypothetical protein
MRENDTRISLPVQRGCKGWQYLTGLTLRAEPQKSKPKATPLLDCSFVNFQYVVVDAQATSSPNLARLFPLKRNVAASTFKRSLT